METGKIPYRLYALSNVGSLLALLLYPSLVEPRVTLHAQRIGWCGGFAMFALLSALLAVKTRSEPRFRKPIVEEDPPAPPSSGRDKVLWVALPMGAAMQLCAVTGYVTANIAPIPVLSILPWPYISSR